MARQRGALLKVSRRRGGAPRSSVSSRRRVGTQPQSARRAGANLEAKRIEAAKADLRAKYAASLKSYEAAVRQIQKQSYDKAIEILDQVIAEGPVEMADRARVYLRFCRQKLQPARKTPKTAEEFYVAGISELNSNKIDQAIEYLARAQKLNPRRSEIHYALAAGYARRGDSDPAIAHLEASIHLDPQIRIQARREEDFQAVAGDPRFAVLVGSAKRGAAARA